MSEPRTVTQLKSGDRVVIIGAGPAGLTAGYLLAKDGVPVTVLEADDVVGGISRTAQYNGYRFDIGGHRFFTKVQVVDDLVGRTLASASTMEADVRTTDGDKSARARKVGELVAERAKAAGVESVVFDRAGHKYHGRVAALADGARDGGLAF